jgi:hypothetical protein
MNWPFHNNGLKSNKVKILQANSGMNNKKSHGTKRNSMGFSLFEECYL